MNVVEEPLGSSIWRMVSGLGTQGEAALLFPLCQLPHNPPSHLQHILQSNKLSLAWPTFSASKALLRSPPFPQKASVFYFKNIKSPYLSCIINKDKQHSPKQFFVCGTRTKHFKPKEVSNKSLIEIQEEKTPKGKNTPTYPSSLRPFLSLICVPSSSSLSKKVVVSVGVWKNIGVTTERNSLSGSLKPRVIPSPGTQPCFDGHKYSLMTKQRVVIHPGWIIL